MVLLNGQNQQQFIKITTKINKEKASATEYSDNIEKTYVPADDTFILVDSANNGIAFSGEIKESTRDIKVVIEFNNSIVKVDDKDYTDMDIKLVGGADNTEIVKNICVDGTNTVVDGVVVSSAVVFEDVTVPYRYTVTVKRCRLQNSKLHNSSRRRYKRG